MPNIQPRYEVRDPEPGENGMPRQIYRTSSANLIAITPWDEYVRNENLIGKRVLVRYLDTTYFFLATKMGSAKGVDISSWILTENVTAS
jgi:hypothetical protein